METTQEKMKEKNQSNTKWLNEASSAVMDVYNKQLGLVFDFYNNFFNSFPGMNKNNWMTNMNFTTPTSEDGALNKMFPAINLFKINDKFVNLSSAQSEGMNKQMMDFINLWNSTIQKQSQSIQKNWGELSEKMKGILEDEWKTRSNIMNSIIEAYNKQLNFSVELNKKFMEELTSQLNLVAKQNEKFCTEALKTSPATEKTEQEQPMAKKTAKAEHSNSHNHNHNHNHNKH